MTDPEKALSDDLELALELSELASAIALPMFARGVDADQKADGSLVTEADFEVERRLIERLAERRPGDAVLSEESGAKGSAERRWILDPIDGTWWFAGGLDSWGTHVALEENGEVVLGVVTRPVAGEWWWAERGKGSYHAELGSRARDERLRVSATESLGDASIAVWTASETELDRALRERGAWAEPTHEAMLELAAGKLDAVVAYMGDVWDLAPAVVLVEEAGGRFMDLDGGRRLSRGGVFSNGHIHAALQHL